MIIKNKADLDASNPESSRSPSPPHSINEPPPPSYDDVTASSSSRQLAPSRIPDVVPRINLHAASTSNLRDAANSRTSLPPVPINELQAIPRKSLHAVPRNDLQETPRHSWHANPRNNLQETPGNRLQAVPRNNLQVVPRNNLHAASMSNMRAAPERNSDDFLTSRRRSDVVAYRNSEEDSRAIDVDMGYTRNWTVARRDPMTRSSSAPADVVRTVDKITLEHRQQDIQGIYHINPRPKKKFLGVMTVNEETESRLTTRKGIVALTLSIGGGEDLSDTVDVKTGSQDGDVTINLTSVMPGTRLHLAAHSVQGHVVLYIPRDYCGYVKLSTHDGSMNVLPGIAAISHLDKATDNKQVLRFGGEKASSSASYCKLHSRRAAVAIGLLGIDHFAPPQKVKRRWYSIS